MTFNGHLRQGWQKGKTGWKIAFPQGWGQGRAVFGGVTAAAAAGLGERAIASGRPLRCLSVQMMRPASPGPVEANAETLRTGKTATFGQVELRQGGKVFATSQLTYGDSRTGVMEVDEPIAAVAEGAHAIPELEYVPGVIPEFTRHVSMRWAKGSPPFSGGDEPELFGYCRFRQPAQGVEAILGLLDVWPCPSLGLLTKPAYASTVNWTVHLLRVPETFDQLFQFRYRTVVARGGFHSAVGQLYDQAGTPLVFTEQLDRV